MVGRLAKNDKATASSTKKTHKAGSTKEASHGKSKAVHTDDVHMADADTDALELDANDRHPDKTMPARQTKRTKVQPNADADENDTENNTSAAAANNPEQERLSRTDQKALLKERRQHKPNAELVTEAKAIWEQVRVKRLDKQQRRQLIDRLMQLVSGKAKEIIFKHDASRIIQCCVKYGVQAQRDKVASELAGEYVRLSQSKYGRFVMSKVLAYCPDHRIAIMKEFHGKVRQLIRHKEASLVIDEMYSQYANAAQRAALMEEFYGPEFAVFKQGNSLIGSDVAKVSSAPSAPRTLQALLAADPARKDGILRHLRQAIDSVLQKSSFNLGRTPILHRAIYEYLVNSDASKVAKDMIELLKDHLVHILHTREGARIVQYCLLHGTPKDRKTIIKSFKGFVSSIARDQFGHTVLLSCFECVDDTVVVSKMILTELLAPVTATSGSVIQAGTDGADTDSKAVSAGASVVGSAAATTVSELLRDKHASRVILFILTGRSLRYQPQSMIEELAAMDTIRATTSKKDDELRFKQLVDAAAPMLVRAVTTNINELLRDRVGGSAIVMETLSRLYGAKGESDADAVVQAIVELVGRDAGPAAAIAASEAAKRKVFDDEDDEDKKVEDDDEDEETDDEEEEEDEEDEDVEEEEKAEVMEEDEEDDAAEDDEEEEEEEEEDDDDAAEDDEEQKTEADATVSQPTTTNTPFHPALALKAERDAQRLAAQGLDMNSSILVNRAATLTIKQLVGLSTSPAKNKSASTNSSPVVAQTFAWKSVLRSSLLEVLAPHFGGWLAYCAQEPRNRSGTALIFLAMLEAAQSDSCSDTTLIAAARKSALADTDTDLNALLETAKANREASAESADTTPTPTKSVYKRKRAAKPAKDTNNRVGNSNTKSHIENVIDILLQSA